MMSRSKIVKIKYLVLLTELLLLLLLQLRMRYKTLLLLSKKKTDYDAKISEIEEKWFPLTDYNKFTNDITDAKTTEKSYLTNLILTLL